MYKLRLKNHKIYKITDSEQSSVLLAYEQNPLPPLISLPRIGLTFGPYDLSVMEPYNEDGYMINLREILNDIKMDLPGVYITKELEKKTMLHAYVQETSSGSFYFVRNKEMGFGEYISFVFYDDEKRRPRIYLPKEKRTYYTAKGWMVPYEEACENKRKLLLEATRSLALS